VAALSFDPAAVTEYLAALGSQTPTLATTWSDGEGFWAILGAYH
jgi:hypothetical protein